MVSAPKRENKPPAIHTRRMRPDQWRFPAIVAGTMKIPEPIMALR
jgi:hypothetical protein